MPPIIVPAVQVRAWETQLAEQMRLGSIFEQFSSRAISTETVQNEGQPMVPNAVITSVMSGQKAGQLYVTIPSLDKLKLRGPKGGNRAKGTEETSKLRWARCFYNVQRKAVVVTDETIDGDAALAYPIIQEQHRQITDYFKDLGDYDKQRAILLGANEDLTDAEAWEGTSAFSGNAPCGLSLHTNFYVIGQSTTSPVSWNSTFATHVGNVITALRAANSGGNVAFTKAKLDKVIDRANATIRPLMGDYRFVIALSQCQAQQLQADTASNGWWNTFVNAGERGTKNRAITGLLGMYRQCMIIVNLRAPLFNATGSSGYSGDALGRFQFVKPWADDATKAYDIDAGDNRIPTTYAYNATAASDVGTFEMGYVLGLGGLLEAEIQKLKYTNDTDDYDFSKGMECRRKIGEMRNDYTDQAVLATAWSTLTVAPKNWSSMVFISATVAGSM